jgi:hypothetical protein
MESCRLVLAKSNIDADDASMLIIEILWERLQNQDTMGPKLAEKLDEKEIVSSEELLMSEVIRSEALINLLERKGIISKGDLHEEIKNVQATMVKAKG